MLRTVAEKVLRTSVSMSMTSPCVLLPPAALFHFAFSFSAFDLEEEPPIAAAAAAFASRNQSAVIGYASFSMFGCHQLACRALFRRSRSTVAASIVAVPTPWDAMDERHAASDATRHGQLVPGSNRTPVQHL